MSIVVGSVGNRTCSTIQILVGKDVTLPQLTESFRMVTEGVLARERARTMAISSALRYLVFFSLSRNKFESDAKIILYI